MSFSKMLFKLLSFKYILWQSLEIKFILTQLQDCSPSPSVKLHIKEDSQASKALMAPLLRMENQWMRPGGTKDSSIMTNIWEPGTFSWASLPALHATF